MQSLTDLNNRSRTAIDVVDSRPAGVIFDRFQAQNQVVDINVTAFVVPVGIDIREIINYQTADVRYRLTINSPHPTPLTGSTLSWGSLPTGVTLSTVGNQYTLSGIDNITQWNLVKYPTWNLPANYATKPLWFITAEIIYYDEALGQEVTVAWDVFDERFYYITQAESTTTMTCQAEKTVEAISSMPALASIYVNLYEYELFVRCAVTADAQAFVGTFANLSSTATMSIAPTDFFAVTYTSVNSVQLSISSGTGGYIGWGDGTSTNYTGGNQVLTHNYATTGNYKVTVGNGITGIACQPTTCQSFGNIGLTKCSFYGATALTTVPNTIPSSITDVSGMFGYCTSFNNANILGWDTSNITNMRSMFSGATAFNQPIGSWNVSKVTDMAYMFSGNTAFNQSIGSWNTVSVNDMYGMFQDNSTFNQNINTWNTTNVQNMQSMFENNTAFNQPIGSWNVSNVNNMQNMFKKATKFNQTINTWNVSKVTNMYGMFQENPIFNQSLTSWNVSNVTDMRWMFAYSVFNQNIDAWNVSKVQRFEFMFLYNTAYNQPMNSWNTSSATNMTSMFSNAINFNQPIGAWRIGNVTNVSGMFASAVPTVHKFNQDLSQWCATNLSASSTRVGFVTTGYNSLNPAYYPLWGACPRGY